jgi:hypothetical protein
MTISWLMAIFRRNRLTDLEDRVIEEVAKAVPRRFGQILRAQKSRIAKVQRLLSGTEVDFYYPTEGPGIPLFDFREIEIELARVLLIGLESGHRAKATVSLVRNKLFCIEFQGPPGDLAGEPLDVVVNLLADFGEENGPSIPG